MEAHSDPRALETMRTYRGRVRASPLHIARLFRSWRLLFSDQRDLLSSHQESYIAKKIYNQLSSWGISADPTPLKSEVERDDRHLQLADNVIRCWLDQNCVLMMNRALLDQSYVGRAMRVERVCRRVRASGSRLPMPATPPPVSRAPLSARLRPRTRSGVSGDRHG